MRATPYVRAEVAAAMEALPGHLEGLRRLVRMELAYGIPAAVVRSWHAEGAGVMADAMYPDAGPERDACFAWHSAMVERWLCEALPSEN